MNKKNIQPSRLIAAILIALGLLFIIFSGINGMRISRQFEGGRHFAPRKSDVNSIQTWMTLRYVSRTYGVPEPEFEKKFGIDPKKYYNSNLAKIADALNKNEAEFLTEVQTFITEFQTTHTEPPQK